MHCARSSLPVVLGANHCSSTSNLVEYWDGVTGEKDERSRPSWEDRCEAEELAQYFKALLFNSLQVDAMSQELENISAY